MPAHQAPFGPRPALLDAALIGVVAVLVLGTIATSITPQLLVGIVSPPLDLVIHTVATVVTISVAALALVRFRQAGERGAAFEAAAFLVLAIVNLLTVLIVTTGLDRPAGMAIESPDEAPLYAIVCARTFAAALLVLGGIASLRSRRVHRGVVVVLGAAVVTLVLLAVVQASAGRLPPLWTIGPAPTSQDVSLAAWSLSPPTPLGAATQALGAALFLWAAGLSRRLYRRDGMTGAGYLAAGLVFAAFAQIQPALYPGAYAGVVTTGDLLRLAFDVILLVGIQAQASAHLASLQLANDAMARSREVDAEHAAMQERTRLSRELHDGLAQDLWLAKLKTGRLAALPDIGTEARALADELGDAIDAGLAEAQHAVAAMRMPGEPIGTFAELMSRCVDEFADRFGLRAEFECEQSLPPLTPRAQAEALRIAREALNNVRRHADATVVRVRAGMEAGRLVVVVGDNGRGFDLDTVGPTAFGLAGMRERASLIGGELRIDSRPQGGTRVSLLLPLALAAVPIGPGSR
jgi:signal transduction histidine kinase